MLPALALLPGLIVVYLLFDMFGGGSSDEDTQQKEGFNTELPVAQAEGVDDKFTEMQRRYGSQSFDAWGEVSAIGAEEEEEEVLVDPRKRGFAELETEEEYEEEDWEEEEDMRQLEEALARNRRLLGGDDYETQETPAEMEARLRREVEAEVARKLAAQNPTPAPVAPAAPAVVEEEKIEVVQKTVAENSVKFNTISSDAEEADKSLIKAMIDQTTKAQDGSRLRFKLLDDVTVSGVDIKKGTYLYGTVVGFGAQRVKVEVNSILYKDQFIKVKLSVFDLDGMEGFYVPASAFREFMRDAAAQTAGTSMQINQNGTSGISGEMLALQALQNIYNSASNAVSGQVRKNRAKIKYGTYVYLINSK